MINILACASDNYTMQCGVLFCSICENNKIEPIHFYVFVDKDFTMDHKQQMEALINKYPQKQVSFITVLDDDVNRFLKLENSYYTRHVFYRLLMAKLLPLTVDRGLYLDCDIIVRKSLRPLWEIDISKKAIGVVRDAQEGVIYQYNRLGYSYDKGYFNSGVLYANLTYWRETNATERLFEYINFHADKIKFLSHIICNLIFYLRLIKWLLTIINIRKNLNHVEKILLSYICQEHAHGLMAVNILLKVNFSSIVIKLFGKIHLYG